MAVIINELEVVLESPSAAPAPAAATAPPRPAAPQQIQPLDMLDINEREERARWRVYAH
jgi:hypothetical protein